MPQVFKDFDLSSVWEAISWADKNYKEAPFIGGNQNPVIAGHQRDGRHICLYLRCTKFPQGLHGSLKIKPRTSQPTDLRLHCGGRILHKEILNWI